MKYAGYNSPYGKAVTANEFEKEAGVNYREKGIFPFCFACKEKVYTKGTLSPNINGHYAHYRYSDDVDPMDYCIESSQGKTCNRLLGLHTDHWDIYHAEKLRWMFFESDNLKSAYCFCLKACGKGNLPIWVVPYILLLLADFSYANKFDFRFVLNKPTRLPLQNLWIDNQYAIFILLIMNCFTVSKSRLVFALFSIKTLSSWFDMSRTLYSELTNVNKND